MIKVARRGVTILAGALFAFVVLEGTSSGAILLSRFYEMVQSRPAELAEWRHTEYDPDLGWINVPNVYIRDMYGPGVSFRTNSQRFRAWRDYDSITPSERVRLICSGDSFTLGYGVSDEHTWCEQLAVLEPRFEPINMGQGGYAVDQTYLWYRRDGATLRPDVLLFAFIGADFGRMQRDDLITNPKPMLRVRDGILVTENVPVPRPGLRPRWVQEMVPLLRELRSFQILGKVAAALRPDQPAEAEVVAAKLVESLRDLTLFSGTTLVLVFLPTEDDYDRDGSANWRRFVDTEAARLG